MDLYSDEPPLMVLQSDGTCVDMTPYRGCVHVSTFAQPGWLVDDVLLTPVNTVLASPPPHLLPNHLHRPQMRCLRRHLDAASLPHRCQRGLTADPLDRFL